MVDELAPDTNEKMRALCKKISVAHDLDAEIQEELYSHMEDKLLAYLNGEEAPAEEDAFILVREHFGDPSALKGLLQDAHAGRARISFARRVAAVLIALQGAHVAYRYLVNSDPMAWLSDPTVAALSLRHAVSFTARLALPWLLLWHWQRRLDDGHTPWFLTWRPAFLVGAMAFLYMLSILEEIARQPGISLSAIWSLSTLLYIAAFGAVCSVLECVVWIWWCDRPPRKARTVIVATALFVAWHWVSLCIGITALWTFMPTHRAFQSGPTLALGLSFALPAVCAVLALALYAIARRATAGLKRRPAKT